MPPTTRSAAKCTPVTTKHAPVVETDPYLLAQDACDVGFILANNPLHKRCPTCQAEFSGRQGNAVCEYFSAAAYHPYDPTVRSIITYYLLGSDQCLSLAPPPP